MSNSQKWLLIGWLIILTLGIIGVGVYTSKKLISLKNDLKREIKEIGKEIEGIKKDIKHLKKQTFLESEEIPKEIETPDWESYRNEKYGFEIRFPKGGKIKKEEIGEKGTPLLYVFIDFPTHFIAEGPPIGKDLRILIVPPEHCSVFDETVSELTFTRKETIIEGPKIVQLGSMEFIKMINGEPAAGSEYTIISYSLSRKDKCFIFAFVIVTSKSIPEKLEQKYLSAVEDEKNLCDQIISTFRLFQ